MTDEQIIKALECCFINKNCKGCPQRGEVDCLRTSSIEAIGLINRQKAEIERLQIEITGNYQTMKQALVLVDKLKQDIAIDIVTAKAEAVKEVAERLKERGFADKYYEHEAIVYVADIDNLVKEMVGEER